MNKFIKLGENKYLNVAHIVQFKIDGDPSAATSDSDDDSQKFRLTLFVNGAPDVRLRGNAAKAVFQQLNLD
jgi:hypothetical protein